ncbi:hypothetical protein CMI41_01670 [Candidatus Pacearchaeota archaeon]|nr:hypothetical protein [Candidatus Pacearchaeota archaeon]|tara:strand:+ start:5028 stop:5642 length:615 start_codon:yes stop_codon:yes gene_type:complete
MKSRGGVLGSGLGTIVAVIFIIAILTVFTLITTAIKSVNFGTEIELEEPLNEDLGAKVFNEKNFNDEFGLKNHTLQSDLQERLLKALASTFSGSMTFSQALIIWDPEDDEIFMENFEGLKDEFAYIEVQKDDEIRYCTRNVCKVGESKRELLLSREEGIPKVYAYLELNLTDSRVIVSDYQFDEQSVYIEAEKDAGIWEELAQP